MIKGNGYKFNFVKTMMMLRGILTFSKFITHKTNKIFVERVGGTV